MAIFLAKKMALLWHFSLDNVDKYGQMDETDHNFRAKLTKSKLQ